MFRWPLRVYIEDTDSGGVVYYANYLRYFERARTEYLRALGLCQSTLMTGAGIAFVVRSLAVDFRRPAVLDDRLCSAVSVLQKKSASLVFDQCISRVDDDPESTLCTAVVKVACVSLREHRPVRLPEHVKEALEREP